MASKCPIVILDEAAKASRYDIFHTLHMSVRSSCKTKKLGMNKLTPAFHKVVQECLIAILKVKTLDSAQSDIAKNFCDQVPSFYRKHKSKLQDVCLRHKDYFLKPLSSDFEEKVEVLVVNPQNDNDNLPSDAVV